VKLGELPAPPGDRAAEHVPGNSRDAEAGGWIDIRPHAGRLGGVPRGELWAFREVLVLLAQRDLKLRYKQTLLGVAWALLQPLAAMLVFGLVFGRVAGIPSDGLPYLVFVYAGLVVWFYLASSVNAAAASLVDNRALVTKVYFPRVLAPAAAVLPGLVDLAVSTALVAALMVAYAVAPTAALLTLPLWVLGAVIVALGAGLWLAALNALYRDVRYALGFLIQLWLFASPVVYASSLVEDGWRWLYALNPLVGVLDGFRWALVGAPSPPLEDATSAAGALVLLVSGLFYFGAAERRMADRI
jgi:lipopolysaccharide transport system permease protein